MHIRLKEWLAGSLLVALSSSVATADPITLIRDQRFVSARALAFRPPGVVAASSREQQVGGDQLTASALAVFGETTASAASQLLSDLSADLHGLSGTGRTSSVSVGPLGDSAASAIFDLSFELDARHAYDFEAAFEALGAGSWQTHLRQSPGEPDQSLLFSFISNTGPQLQVRRRGSLDPGRYLLTVRSDAAGNTIFGGRPSGESTFTFAFDMTPVPEPGSLLLVGSGALGLLARVRRRTRP